MACKRTNCLADCGHIDHFLGVCSHLLDFPVFRLTARSGAFLVYCHPGNDISAPLVCERSCIDG